MVHVTMWVSISTARTTTLIGNGLAQSLSKRAGSARSAGGRTPRLWLSARAMLHISALAVVKSTSALLDRLPQIV